MPEDERHFTLHELGPCCSCGKYGESVRNIVMLHEIGPTPDRGWGCFACGLGPQGAVAVQCDYCLLSHAPIIYVCAGDDSLGRVRLDSLPHTPFNHDMRNHPGERQDE